jgi:hypothetical protein
LGKQPGNVNRRANEITKEHSERARARERESERARERKRKSEGERS